MRPGPLAEPRPKRDGTPAPGIGSPLLLKGGSCGARSSPGGGREINPGGGGTSGTGAGSACAAAGTTCGGSSTTAGGGAGCGGAPGRSQPTLSGAAGGAAGACPRAADPAGARQPAATASRARNTRVILPPSIPTGVSSVTLGRRG